MERRIKEELKKLEATHHIKVLYAVESGSRAWGFASKDSDWDVRFLYVQHPDWYLSIDDKKDSIEVMLPNDLDFAGWDLRKTLKLFRKSNSPLLEWLRSPLIYLEQSSTAESMRKLSDEFFNPKSCTYHYLHMASGNFKANLQGDRVKMKKYFYVLRPILACRWIAQTNTMAPMEFSELVETQVEDRALKKAIEQLLERKMSGDEMDLEPRIDIIHDFVEKELTRFCEAVGNYEIPTPPDTEKLDKLFRDTLEEVWNN